MNYEKLLRAALNDAHYEQYGYSADGFELSEPEQAELDRIEAEIHAEAAAQKAADWERLRAEHPGKTDSEIRQMMLNKLIRMSLDFIEAPHD